MQTYEFDYLTYKKSIKKRKNYSVLIMVLVISVLMCTYFLILPKTRTSTYYFIRINSYLTYKEANKLANELQSKSAGGYIYFDGKYHVFASFYPSQQEADNVLSNLIDSYPTANIYFLETKSIKTYHVDNVITNSLKCQINIINQLYNMIVGLDKNELSDNQFTIMFNRLKKDFDNTKSEYKSFYKHTSDANIITAYDTLDNISKSLDNISNLTPKANCYQYKYELINIVFNHSSFLDCL